MKTKNKKILIGIIALVLAVIFSAIGYVLVEKNSKLANLTQEDKRAMTYGELTEEDKKVEGTDYVQFSAFFLRDLNNDGYAEKMKGTCKPLGANDELYIDLNVLTKGYLKNGKITLNADNFTWNTSIVEDNVFKGNYIGNTTVLNLQDKVMNGSQKVVWGDISAKLNSNINNYSKVNSITLTGTHVIENDDGTITQTDITKTVNLTVDWYGETQTTIYSKNEENNINTLIRDDKAVLEFSFNINETTDSKEQLLLQKQVAEVTIPMLNGYEPTSVVATDSGVEYNYDSNSKKLTITRQSKVNENGRITTSIAKYNQYNVRVEYPAEAHNLTGENIAKFTIPITGYNYGYNNPNEEFTTPYVSEDSATKSVIYKTIEVQGYVWKLDTKVGEYLRNYNNNYNEYVVSKENPMSIYNGNNDESIDSYNVIWKLDIGTFENIENIILEEQKEEGKNKADKFDDEQSMYDYIKTTGIYFGEASELLGEDGWIKIYDAEDNELIATFGENEWNNYKKDSPYQVNLKSIKIETSKPIRNSNLYVYQIKEINDELLTSRYTEDEFNELDYIFSYLKGTLKFENGQEDSTLDRTGYAHYEIPYSNQQVLVYPSKVTTQETKTVDIRINTYNSSALEAKWINGVFLVELPEEIIKLNVNSISSLNENVKVSSYYTYKQDDKYFIKIFIENEEKALYNININADITPNPLLSTRKNKIKLYGYNEYCDNYKEKTSDFYDIDADNLTDDKVGYSEYDLELTSVGAAGILTTEYVTDYDDNEGVTIAPNVAEIEKTDNSRTAKMNVSITSNYSGTLSEIAILGRIPFEGNKYVINGGNLGSRFTVNMTGPISIPADLQASVTVYYSENGNATKELADANNGWTTNVTDWSKIKTYLIDLGDYVLQNGENKIFNYEILVPGGLGYNSYSFGHHAVYYCLDTENGKLEISTEPNKVGIQVVGKYKINLLKNRQNNENKLIEGATFSLTTTDADGKEVTQIAKTDINGQLQFEGIYIEKYYELKEIIAPNNYAVLENPINFKLEIGANNQPVFNITNGSFKETPVISLDDKGNYIVSTKLEDEPRYDLQITKNKVNDNTLFVKNAKFTATTSGEDGNTISSSGTTNENGIANIKGLYLNKEYTLREVSVNPDYEISTEEIKFIGRLNSNGDLTFEVTSTSNFKSTPVITEENGVDVVKVNLEDEIKYTLNINKKGENNAPLPGVKFILTGSTGAEMFKTSENGTATVSGLSLNTTYTLEETKSTGYYLFEEPKTFKVVRNNNGQLVMQSEDAEFQNANVVETVGVAQATVTVDIENEKIPRYTLQIVKVEEDSSKTNLSEMTKLANAKFRVTSDDTQEENEYTTDANGIIEIPDLYQYIEGKNSISAEYEIKELQAPNGYSNNAEEVILVVKGTQNEGLQAEVKNKDDITTFKTAMVDGNKVILVLQDKPLFRLRKIDSETGLPLANAEFIIYEVNANGNEIDYGKDPNGQYVGTLNENGDYTVTTDANGVISLPLRNGTYKAVEVTYPDGYQELGTEEFFKIQENKGQTEENQEENEDIPSSIYQEEEIDESQYTIHEISSIDDLVEFSNNVNSGNGYANYIVKLTKDLDFNDDTCYEDVSIKPQLIKGDETTGFTPIGSAADKTFNGIFDGQEHTISNLYIKSNLNSVGLFGVVKNAKILNLNVSGEINKIGSTATGVAGIIGATYYSNNNDDCKMLIKNCTSNVNINASVEEIPYVAGGIIGAIQMPNTVIINCTNLGEIKGSSYAGGIVGENIPYPVKIINCKNEGKVSGEYINGGIIGRMYANSTVYNCSNSGEITSTYLQGNGDVCTGGIIGQSASAGTIIVKCYNTGKISGKGDVGGIIAYLNATPSNPISNCYNSGEIVTEGNSRSNRVGGIIGISYQSCDINNCYNTGNISSNATSSREVYSGGIIGTKYGTCNINNCHNTGEISGTGSSVYISGILGDNESSSSPLKIANCYNTGNITSTATRTSSGGGYTYVSGIAGGSTALEIKNCYNTGNLEVTNGRFYENFAGGIFAGNCEIIEDCYNTGEVKVIGGGYILAGGILGQKTASGSTINRCYNLADVTGINIDSDHYEYIEVYGIGGKNAINCYNTGDVYGKLGTTSTSVQIYVGGICNGTPVNSYNIGNVSANAKVTPYDGTHAGTLNSSYNGENAVNSYYLDSIKVLGDNIAKKGEAVSKEYMKSKEFYNKLNTYGGWVYRKNRYPVLTKVISGDIVPSTEISIKNTMKTFKITTEVKNDVGGDISGRSQAAYETVTYNENSTKDIVMTPSTGYGITNITINDEEIPFKLTEDNASYTIPGGYFTNMKEDKHVVVTYAQLTQMFTIEKIDASDNTKKLEGAKFLVTDYLEEWAENKLGVLTPNGVTTAAIDKTNEITGVVGSIQNNGTDYVFNTVEVTPEEGTPYNTYESCSDMPTNNTCYSYFPINLTGRTGKYKIAVTAKISAGESCYGYATITNTTDDVDYNVTEGRFIDLRRTLSYANTDTEYIYELEGGQTYYLHIGYYKSRYADLEDDDKFTVSGIKVYGTNEKVYNFEEVDGKYISTNQYVDDTTSNSYIPIDLRDVYGNYKLTINAQVLSNGQSSDYGYATITNSTDAPSASQSTGKFMSNSGSSNEAKDYTKMLSGGQMYYLHFGYYKNNAISTGEDKLIINSVNLSIEAKDNFYTEVITNEDGIAKFGVPSARTLYILETEAPEGYTPTEGYTIVESSEGAVTMKNTKKTGLTVHHYLKGTTNKVAPDEEYIGDIGKEYTTSPHIDLEKVTLQKDTDGNYVIPENASGTYEEGGTEVIYYYEVEPITLTIHHYLDGTETKLVDDEVIKTDTTVEFEGDEYTVSANGSYKLNTNSNYTNLIETYNLTSTRSTVQEETNIGDTVQYTTNAEISYYYETKTYEYSVHYFYDGEEDEENIETVTVNEKGTIEEYTDKNKDEYRFDRVKALNSEGEEVDLPLQITENEETNVINVYYVKNTYSYEVHYFYNGIEDQTKMYTYLAYAGTQISTYKDKNKAGYRLDKVETLNTENNQLPLVIGQDITKNVINVYYVIKDASVLVHHYIDGTTTKVPLQTEGVTVSDELKEGKVFDSYETSPATNVSNKYELVTTKMPQNAEGQMTEDQIVVTYYYALKDAQVNVKYLEKGTNEVLAEEETINGKVDDTYETVKKTVTNYTYVEDTQNTEGKMTVEPIEVIYYYLQNTSAKVQYIDKTTNEIIEERTEQGKVGDIFETVAKDFENYVLVEEPEEKSVTMEKEQIVLKYYYIHIAGGVVEKHIDVVTEDILYNKAYEGNEGDQYEMFAKEFTGYDLVESKLPKNSKGTMTVEPIEVKYYYIRQAKVEVEYLDKATGKKLADDEEIQGHQNDKYETEEKEVKGYSLVETPKNAKGTMKVEVVKNENGTIEVNNVTKVKYYYAQKSAGVTERHIDVKTNELIEDTTEYEGNIGDKYSTKAKDFEDYDIVESKLPKNAEGEMTEEEIIVDYYYIKKAKVIIRYVDKDTGEEIIKEVEKDGHIDDEYKTKPEEIEGYRLVIEELPGNISGNMTEEDKIIVYYYEKIEDSEEKEEEQKDKDEEKEEEQKDKDEEKEEEQKEKDEEKEQEEKDKEEEEKEEEYKAEEKEYKTPDEKEYKTPDVEETTKVEEKQVNPYTGDNIVKTVMVFMFSVVVLLLIKIIKFDE